MSDFVHSFWELKTEVELPDQFCLHALPDACVNILFNQADTRIAGVTALRTTYEVLNLGKEFHYVGIQFLPGVWQGNQNETTDSFVGTPYIGELPLIETSKELARLDFAGKLPVFSKLVYQLADQRRVVVNAVTATILSKAFPTDMGVYGAGGALVKREGANPGIGGTTVYFGVEDCSIEEARVSDAGGQVIRPKMSIGEFGWISLCMDTEGNMFGLSSMK